MFDFFLYFLDIWMDDDCVLHGNKNLSECMCTAAFGVAVSRFLPPNISLINETKAALLRQHPRVGFPAGNLLKFEATLKLFAQKRKESNRIQTNQA